MSTRHFLLLHIIYFINTFITDKSQNLLKRQLRSIKFNVIAKLAYNRNQRYPVKKIKLRNYKIAKNMIKFEN